eukprot:TRINITY_DN61104_c0_g1_i1.p1 TRINITY_DN61104_c0_g1~~TRINITY_DN61104_c0_g1_i1.p1  ORF type:complete len:570 (+),score=165.13 TRINITY_DN61104_c0_g1_i1:88-1797(+)
MRDAVVLVEEASEPIAESPRKPAPQAGACGACSGAALAASVALNIFLLFGLGAAWWQGLAHSPAAAPLAAPRQLPPVPRQIEREIRAMAEDAERIIEHITRGPGRGRSFKRLADFCDVQGPRISGSDRLENAIDAQLPLLEADGLENVHTEAAMVPRWVRGHEQSEIVWPLVGGERYQLHMLGLGFSVGTQNAPGGAIEAKVLVVNSFDELDRRAAEARGKIVVTNPQYTGYGPTGIYRREGASRAARYGAVAYMHRAIGPYGLQTPHTGVQTYADDVTKIPTASLSMHDAELLERMHRRTGGNVTVRIQMGAHELPMRRSRNVLAEWRGSEKPDEVVLIGGHFDSWDVGTGAMDDYGGFVISWEVLSTLRELGLRPKRTIRIIGWTAEEVGGQGADQYFKDHAGEKHKFQMVAESDGGVFDPVGLAFSGNEAAQAIMTHVMELAAPIGANALRGGGGGADINMWIEAGVPGASLPNLANRNYTGPGSEVKGATKGGPMGDAQHFQGDYFNYHHTTSDTVSVQDPVQMDRCAATWAIAAYAVANLDDMLPRDAHPSKALLDSLPRDDCP